MADPEDRKFPPGNVPDTDGDEPQPWGAGAAPPGARWRRRALWAGAAVVAVVVAVTVGWPSVAPLMPGTVTALFEDGAPSPDPELASLGARIEALESAVARLDGRIASAAATARAALPQSDAARLAARIEALETRPTPGPPAPDKRIDPLAQKVDALGRRLDRLERVAAATAGAPSGAQGAGTSPALAALLAENARLAAELGRMTERIARLEAAGDPELAGKVEAAGARGRGDRGRSETPFGVRPDAQGGRAAARRRTSCARRPRVRAPSTSSSGSSSSGGGRCRNRGSRRPARGVLARGRPDTGGAQGAISGTRRQGRTGRPRSGGRGLAEPDRRTVLPRRDRPPGG